MMTYHAGCIKYYKMQCWPIAMYMNKGLLFDFRGWTTTLV